jgi:hypothetical protein
MKRLKQKATKFTSLREFCRNRANLRSLCYLLFKFLWFFARMNLAFFACSRKLSELPSVENSVRRLRFLCCLLFNLCGLRLSPILLPLRSRQCIKVFPIF